MRESLSWQRVVVTFLVVRMIGSLLHAFAPVTKPHMWRQVDTMGVALRYARRWTIEADDFAWWIPSVLNSGDTRGIMAMEFPLVNMLGALGFLVAGHDVDLGRMLAQLFLMVFITALIFWNWKVWSKTSMLVARGVLFASCLGFATPFTAKFMPDLTAMLLATLGVGMIVSRRLLGVVLLGLGTLVKPTAAPVVGLVCLLPFLDCSAMGKSFSRADVLRSLILCMTAGLFPAAWYLRVVPYLTSLEEGVSLFTIYNKPDLLNFLSSFWSSMGVYDVIHFHAIFPFGLIVLFIGLLIVLRQRLSSASVEITYFTGLMLGFVLLVQLSFIGAVSGDHAALHVYYLLAVGPTIGIAVELIWRRVNSPWWKLFICVGLLARASEAFFADTKGYWDKSQGPSLFTECRSLREFKDAPWGQGVVWRTPIEEFPLIELCLGERGRSAKSKWGIIHSGQKVGETCEVVKAAPRLSLIRCAES
jgi:hypothetical protein